tara:strand:- start:108 stop:737 length:630 start_codon:yes stop_codon:yes gene_type:complete
MEKPNYYAVIPAEVRYNRKLTPNAKLLYAEITALCNMNGKCNASTKYFANLYEVSRVSVQNWLKLLEENNYISRTVIYKEGSKEILSRSIKLINNPCKNIFTDNTNINIKNTNITYSNKDISIRRLKFINDVNKLGYGYYDKNILDGFTDYWTEPNKSNTKMKFELQQTWSTNLRLKTWAKNQKKWDKPKTMSKLDAQINEWQEAKKLL